MAFLSAVNLAKAITFSKISAVAYEKTGEAATRYVDVYKDGIHLTSPRFEAGSGGAVFGLH
jgi:hypothetical protein